MIVRASNLSSGLACGALEAPFRLAIEFVDDTTLAGITLSLHIVNDSIAIIKPKNTGNASGKTPMFWVLVKVIIIKTNV
jgi:hypothetical protein